MKLSSIASILETEFDSADIEITGMNALKDATSTEVSFVANSKYIKDIQSTKAAAVIVPASLIEHVPSGCIALVVENSYWSMAILSQYFAPVIEDDNLLLLI
jgi:UDP-3-O-[3-hydroxymyristoyl] glucosamine N-acyltransferase